MKSVMVTQVTKHDKDVTPVTVTVTQSCDIEKILEQIMSYNIAITYWPYGKHIYFRLG